MTAILLFWVMYGHDVQIWWQGIKTGKRMRERKVKIRSWIKGTAAKIFKLSEDSKDEKRGEKQA